MITPHTPKILYKKFYFFSQSIRMSRENVNFGDKKIEKVTSVKTKKLPR